LLSRVPNSSSLALRGVTTSSSYTRKPQGQGGRVGGVEREEEGESRWYNTGASAAGHPVLQHRACHSSLFNNVLATKMSTEITAEWNAQ
jgi:hypothetical protein